MRKTSLFVVLFLVGCVSQPPETICVTDEVTLQGDYPGARLGHCRVLGERSFLLTNKPEDTPINHSPWYGFKIEGKPGPLDVSIMYSVHEHRYRPKFSKDNITWYPLRKDHFVVSPEGKSIKLELQVEEHPIWISAQENLTSQWYEEWIKGLAFISKPEVIGYSAGRRNIWMFETNPQARDVLLIVGRQHPPEVTGAFGLRYFVDYLLEGDQTTCGDRISLCEFFARTNIVVVPNLNPDGVELGHWRHGLGHLDLNRDWGPFTQPETAAVKTMIDKIVSEGKQIRLFLDFHSTSRNLFYTQSDEEKTGPEMFATRWLKLATEMGVYEFSQERRHNEGRPTSKNYMFSRFGIPAITYEVGDETDRKLIQESARIFADAMTKVLN